MQNAFEVGVLSLGSSDVDDCGLFESGLKEIHDPIPRVIVQSVENFVNHDPVRLV